MTVSNFFFGEGKVEGASGAVGVSGGGTGGGGSNNYVSVVTFDINDGVLTLQRQGLGNLTVDLDGRYALQSTVDAIGLQEVTNVNHVTTNPLVSGEARMSTWSSLGTYAHFGHKDKNNSTEYGLLHTSLGKLILNSTSTLDLNINDTTKAWVDSSGFEIAGNLDLSGNINSGGYGIFDDYLRVDGSGALLRLYGTTTVYTEYHQTAGRSGYFGFSGDINSTTMTWINELADSDIYIKASRNVLVRSNLIVGDQSNLNYISIDHGGSAQTKYLEIKNGSDGLHSIRAQYGSSGNLLLRDDKNSKEIWESTTNSEFKVHQNQLNLGDISLLPQKKLILDSGSGDHSYIWEGANGIIRVVSGGVQSAELKGGESNFPANVNAGGYLYSTASRGWLLGDVSGVNRLYQIGGVFEFINSSNSLARVRGGDGINLNDFVTVQQLNAAHTLQTVTDNGATTSQAITVGGLTVNGQSYFNNNIWIGGNNLITYGSGSLRMDAAVGNALYFGANGRVGDLTIHTNGLAQFVAEVKATSFIKTGGLATQFLKADGSIDSNTYLTSANLANVAYTHIDNGFTTHQTVNGHIYQDTANPYLQQKHSGTSVTYIGTEFGGLGYGSSLNSLIYSYGNKLTIWVSGTPTTRFDFTSTGLTVSGITTSNAFVKSVGPFGFLKSDGTTDSNTYLVSADLAGYALLSGASFSGNVSTTGILTASGGNSSNWNTAFSWGNWATGVNKAFVDALGTNADTVDGYHAQISYSVNTATVRDDNGYIYTSWHHQQDNTGLYQSQGNYFYTNIAGWRSRSGSDSVSRIELQFKTSGSVAGYLHSESGNVIGLMDQSANWSIKLNQNGGQIHSNTGSYTTLDLLDLGDVYRGSLYANTNNQVGILDSDGNWAYRHSTDTSNEWFINDTVYATLTTSGLTVVGKISTGIGLTEVHLMNQNLRTSDPVTFGGLTLNGDTTINGDYWLTLLTSNIGVQGISVGESGKKGSAAIHITYNGNGRGYIGMGTVDSAGVPAYARISFHYNSNTIGYGGVYNGSYNHYFHGSVYSTGTITTASNGNSDQWNQAYGSRPVGLSFNASTGVLTLDRQTFSDLTIDLDGRYVTVNNYADSLSYNSGTGLLTLGRSGLGDLTTTIDLMTDTVSGDDVYFIAAGDNTRTNAITVPAGGYYWIRGHIWVESDSTAGIKISLGTSTNTGSIGSTNVLPTYAAICNTDNLGTGGYTAASVSVRVWMDSGTNYYLHAHQNGNNKPRYRATPQNGLVFPLSYVNVVKTS